MKCRRSFMTGFAALLTAGMLVGGAAPAMSVMAASSSVSSSGQITLASAKEAALKDAGFKKSDVVFKKAVLDTDDDTGFTKFEVDFYADDLEYEYDIDPVSAEVIKTDTEQMDAEDYAEMNALKEQAKKASAKRAGKHTAKSTEKAAAAEEEITEEKALEIALTDAGVSKDQISFSNVHLDYDDDTGITSFDVEFHVGAKEYNYDINPDTGKILSSEAEIDD